MRKVLVSVILALFLAPAARAQYPVEWDAIREANRTLYIMTDAASLPKHIVRLASSGVEIKMIIEMPAAVNSCESIKVLLRRNAEIWVTDRSVSNNFVVADGRVVGDVDKRVLCRDAKMAEEYILKWRIRLGYRTIPAMDPTMFK